MKSLPPIRPSPIAGTWYSADPRRLQAQVDEYLAQAELPKLDGKVVGVIAPHAGHRYSGVTAGYAFRAVLGLAPRVVVILSPYHRYHSGDVLTTAHHAYQTPLGDVWVHEGLMQALQQELAADGMEITRVAHDSEHALEIELPFLQRALAGSFELLPLMVRCQNQAAAQVLGTSLGKVLAREQALLVASTDLSHFYPLEIASTLDQEMLRRMAAFSPEAVLEAEQTGTGFACGAYAVAAAMWAARELGAQRVQVLHHSTSADQTGDASSVVGYGAAVFLQPQ